MLKKYFHSMLIAVFTLLSCIALARIKTNNTYWQIQDRWLKIN